jgi:hypothetical protein
MTESERLVAEGRAFAEGLAEGIKKPLFWHGGAPGRRPQDWLEAPEVSGARSMASYLRPADLAAIRAIKPGAIAESFVYVTTRRNAARAFASMWCDGKRQCGSLYVVQPEGELELDPDCPDGTSFRCRRAQVLLVESTQVSMDLERALMYLEQGPAL